MNIDRMNPEVKALWLTALRSGEYDQGVGALARGSEDSVSYCCLGVLCEVAIQNGVDVPTYWDENTKFYGALHSCAGLPAEVREWSGVDEYGTLPGYTQLSELNDMAGMSFEEIADIIERCL